MPLNLLSGMTFKVSSNMEELSEKDRQREVSVRKNLEIQNHLLLSKKRRFYHHESQKAVPDDIANFYTVFTEETILHCMCLLFCASSQSPEGE